MWRLILRAEVISVGTELLLGQIVDTDAAYISRLLPDFGIDMHFRSTVGDNFGRVVEAIRLALSRADIVFTIGGLGPTEDDLTKEAVAEAIGVELELDEPSAEHIRGFFAARGIPMPERNLKQAMKPKEGRALPNPVGTAPGSVFEKGGKVVITLPGPPNEFTEMVEHGVLPYLREMVGEAPALIRSKNLKIVGLGESSVEEIVRDLVHGTNPSVAPYASPGEVRLRITAKSEDDEQAWEMIAGVEREIRARLGDRVFGVDEETLESVVVGMMAERGVTLGIAESCTGGLLGHRITNVPGSSEVFLAGIVSYSNDSKVKLLGVPKELIERCGAVSREVAEEMARGVREASGARIGMGITGIAGPGGGTATKPVGLVYIALSTEADTLSEENRFVGNRADVKARSAQSALVMLRQHLLDLPL